MAKKSTKKTNNSTESKRNKAVKRTVKAVAKSNNPVVITIAVLLVIAIIALAVYGYTQGWFDAILNPSESGGGTQNDVNTATYNVQTIANEELSVHFLELGNKYAGDCVYIKAGQTDILIDAGSRQSSATTIAAYVDQFCTDKKLEYVVATHADQDHIAGFVGSDNKGIFDVYKCETIIDFNLTNKSPTTKSGGKSLYGKYLEKRNAEVSNDGANHFSALDCYNNTNGAQRVFTLSDSIEMEVLYNYYYENTSSDENNYSVCLLIRQFCDGYNFDNRNDPQNANFVRNYLFTGDLEKDGEERLVENNDLPQVELFKAGHHGSKTSSNDCLLSVIKPKVVCVCCCAGSDEYSDKEENKFPTQAMIDRVSVYTDAVYVTTLSLDVADSDGKEYASLNGNIVFACTNGKTSMYFSNNDTKLKDTDWFKNKRTCPPKWQQSEGV